MYVYIYMTPHPKLCFNIWWHIWRVLFTSNWEDFSGEPGSRLQLWASGWSGDSGCGGSGWCQKSKNITQWAHFVQSCSSLKTLCFYRIRTFFNSGLVAFRMLTDMTNHLQHCGILGFNSSNPALSTLSWLDTVSSGQQVFARDLRSMTGSSPT